MNSSNVSYIEDLYERYLNDPSDCPPEWLQFFRENFDSDRPVHYGAASPPPGSAESNGAAHASADRNGHADSAPQYAGYPSEPSAAERALAADKWRQDRVDQLIRGYRTRGHLAAKLDPLGRPRPEHAELTLAHYGLTEADLDRMFSTDTFKANTAGSLRTILDRLESTYCRSIGVQYMHIDDVNLRHWVQDQIETTRNDFVLTPQLQTRILKRLTDAVEFEVFIRRRHQGHKTFSLEGAETLIPLLDLALLEAADDGVTEVVVAMAHRGRLNVLANIFGKREKNIFWTFEDPDPERSIGGGDVRYHLGYSSDYPLDNGKLHLSMCFNPSHLEFVNPVALGRVRAKQDEKGDVDRTQVLTVLIHGDASFAGEGIVPETLNLSQLPGYRTGGTLHIVINNQVGFTTTPEQSRSTTYATDVARMLDVPIFHVNGEDPEAVAQVVKLAMEFRAHCQRDVVIDMYCFRRHGHNEGDEPRFTQAQMYEVIDNRGSVRDIYLEHLLKLGGITREEADKIAEDRRERLEKEFEQARTSKFTDDSPTLQGMWKGYYGGFERKDDDPETGLPRETLDKLLQHLSTAPNGFELQSKLQRVLQLRQEMVGGTRPLDWSTGELLAMASLATEGHRIRFTGQDSERGTFSSRHSVFHDTRDDSPYHMMEHVSADQAPVEIVNSPLSETAVLGFEYGYSLNMPDALVAWEAQFGDFWNVAQVIVDQFITSAEDKWKRYSGITLLLPHGFEGQGPEHCSARVERFLMLSAEHNIQVCQPTTPANYYHLLRRQVHRKWRKPLVVLTPKGLLRHPRCVSDLTEFESGRFRRVLGDKTAKKAGSELRRVLLCTGKIYYDLIKERKERGIRDVAIMRLEQLYPLPEDELREALADVPEDCDIVWIQDEPSNMGASWFLRVNFGETLFGRWPWRVISRNESASPSTGSAKAHQLEQSRLLEAAFLDEDEKDLPGIYIQSRRDMSGT